MYILSFCVSLFKLWAPFAVQANIQHIPHIQSYYYPFPHIFTKSLSSLSSYSVLLSQLLSQRLFLTPNPENIQVPFRKKGSNDNNRQKYNNGPCSKLMCLIGMIMSIPIPSLRPTPIRQARMNHGKYSQGRKCNT